MSGRLQCRPPDDPAPPPPRLPPAPPPLKTPPPRPSARRPLAPWASLGVAVIASIASIACLAPIARAAPPAPTSAPVAGSSTTPTEAPAPSAARAVLAHADGRTYWVAGVDAEPPAGPGGLAGVGRPARPEGPRTVVRSRELNRDGAWRSVADLPGRAVDLADFRGDLAVLLDDGRWLTVFPGGSGRFVTPPDAVKLVALAAGDGGTLWGLAERVRPAKSPATAPAADVPAPAVVPAAAPADGSTDGPTTAPASRPSGLPGYELWSYAAGKWSKVADVPADLAPPEGGAEPVDPPRPSLTVAGGSPFAAFAVSADASGPAADASGPAADASGPADDQAVRVLRWAGDDWRDAGTVAPEAPGEAGETRPTVAAFELLAGSAEPALWVADAGGRETLFRAAPAETSGDGMSGDGTSVGTSDGPTFAGVGGRLDFAGPPPSPTRTGVTIAAGTLRVVYAAGEGGGQVVEQGFAATDLRAVGPASC